MRYPSFTAEDIWVETESESRRLLEHGLSAAQDDGFDYWKAESRDGEPPPVSAIDPVRIPNSALPWVDLIGVEGVPPRFVIRLWGTGLVSAVGRDLKGTDLALAGMTSAVRRLTAVVEERRPYFAAIPMDWHSERYKQGHIYTSLGMPFQEPDGTISRILCLLSFE